MSEAGAAKAKKVYDNPVVECDLCGASIRKRGLKAHNKTDACRVVAARREATSRGFVSYYSEGFEELCQHVGIRVYRDLYSHKRAVWGKKSRTIDTLYVPRWSKALFEATGYKDSVADRTRVMLTVASDQGTIDAIVSLCVLSEDNAMYPFVNTEETDQEVSPLASFARSLIESCRKVELPEEVLAFAKRWDAREEESDDGAER